MGQPELFWGSLPFLSIAAEAGDCNVSYAVISSARNRKDMISRCRFKSEDAITIRTEVMVTLKQIFPLMFRMGADISKAGTPSEIAISKCLFPAIRGDVSSIDGRRISGVLLSPFPLVLAVALFTLLCLLILSSVLTHFLWMSLGVVLAGSDSTRVAVPFVPIRHLRSIPFCN